MHVWLTFLHLSTLLSLPPPPSPSLCPVSIECPWRRVSLEQLEGAYSLQSKLFCSYSIALCTHSLLPFVDSLFGDDQEVAFWTVALYYMLREKNRLQDPRYKVTSPPSLLFSHLQAGFTECCTVLIGLQVRSSS